MPRCNCNAHVCSCVLQEGDNITITGAGTVSNPYVIEAGEFGGGGSGWESGDLKLVASTATPGGWLECQGQAVSRAAYPDLFDALGTTWGSGNGTTTFNVPNMKGRVPVGAGDAYDLGESGGAASNTLNVTNLPPHTHTINHNHGQFDSGSGGAHKHQLDMSNEDGTNNDRIRRGGAHVADSNGAVETTGTHSHEIDVPAFTGDSGDGEGMGSSFSLMQPYRVVRYLIKT